MRVWWRASAAPKALGATEPRLRPLVPPVALYLVSRASVLFAAFAATWFERRLTVQDALTGWDAGWFIRIARSGYPDSLGAEPGGGNRWAFFPGFPASVRAVVSTTGLSYQTAGIVVGFLTGLGASIAIWLLVSRRFGRDVATRTVGLFVFFPAAYTLSMAYSDGLFILSAACCLLWLDRRRWALAGLAASVACLTRGFGVVLVASCLVEAVLASWRSRRVTPLLASVTAPIGFLLWSGYQWKRVDDPLAFNKAYELWGSDFVWFRTPFDSAWRLMSTTSAWGSAPDVMATLGLLFVVVGLLLLSRLHLTSRPVPWGWWVDGLGSGLLAFTPFWPTRVLRYTMAVIPAFVGFAWHLRREWTPAVLAGLSAIQASIALVAFVSVVTWQTAPFAP